MAGSLFPLPSLTYLSSQWFVFCRLIESANGIPRPRPEDLQEKESDEIDYKKLYAQKQKEKHQASKSSLISVLSD